MAGSENYGLFILVAWHLLV